MVEILFYWFRFAEASRKSHMVQMNKCLISKKPSHSLHVVAVLPQATQKSRLGSGNPSPQPLSTASPVPVFPGGCLAPAGSLGDALLCLPLGLGF